VFVFVSVPPRSRHGGELLSSTYRQRAIWWLDVLLVCWH